MSNKIPFIKTSVVPLPNQKNYHGVESYNRTMIEDWEKFPSDKFYISERWQGCVTITHPNEEHSTCKVYFSFEQAKRSVLAEADMLKRHHNKNNSGPVEDCYVRD